MSFKESFLLYLCAVLFAGGCLWPGRTAAAAEAPVSVGERGTAARGNAGQYVGLGQALGVSLLKKRQAVLRVGARNFLVEKNDGPGNFAALPAVTVALKRDKTAVGPEVGNPVLVVGGKRRSPVPAGRELGVEGKTEKPVPVVKAFEVPADNTGRRFSRPIGARVSTARINLRIGPTAGAGIVGVLHGGEYVTALGLTGKDHKWVEIAWPKRILAWVERRLVKAESGTTWPRKGTVVGRRAPIYARGTPAARALAKPRRGTELMLLGEVGDWYRVEAPVEAHAYLYGRYVMLGVRRPGATTAPEAVAEVPEADEKNEAAALKVASKATVVKQEAAPKAKAAVPTVAAKANAAPLIEVDEQAEADGSSVGARAGVSDEPAGAPVATKADERPVAPSAAPAGIPARETSWPSNRSSSEKPVETGDASTKGEAEKTMRVKIVTENKPEAQAGSASGGVTAVAESRVVNSAEKCKAVAEESVAPRQEKTFAAEKSVSLPASFVPAPPVVRLPVRARMVGPLSGSGVVRSAAGVVEPADFSTPRGADYRLRGTSGDFLYLCADGTGLETYVGRQVTVTGRVVSVGRSADMLRVAFVRSVE